MPESFNNSSWRCAAIAFSAAAAIWLSYAGVKHEWANHYGASSNPQDWPRAAEIEPGNAENWYRLGRYRQLDFENADLPLAISYYRRAVQLDPRSPYYKLDLASALETSGNDSEAEKYFRAAQQSYPISAEVSWRYGNFLLRAQRLPEAYAELHRGVMVDSKLIPLTISVVWHSNPDVRVLLDQVLPNTPEANQEALSFLVQAEEGTAAMAAWNQLASQKPAPDWKKSFPLIDMLLHQMRLDDAGSVWRQALAVAGVPSPASSDGTLVFDGGFESDISNGGFGWRIQDVPSADLNFDAGEKHSGARSARITFDGTQNISYENFYQYVLVHPGTHYHFSGFLHTDSISTESGIRFEIRSQGLDVLTPNETGSQPWNLVEAEFTTGPQTHLIQITLRRLPSERLDNKLSGTVWLDDVAVVPVGAPR